MMIVVLKGLAVLALVLVNGFFVTAEFALVKIRETRLIELVEQGHFRARVARSLTRHLDAYLSACQLGVTFASLGLGWVGEPLVAVQLEPLLRRMGINSEAAVSSISVAVGFALISFLHIVLGEQAPKSLAIRRTEAAALWVAVPLRLFHLLFYPAIWVLNTAAGGALRLLGITLATEKELALSETELQMLLAESARGGQISEQEKKISERALRFADLKARQVMVPRKEIVYFSLADSLEANLAKARANNFARYPLCEKDLDTVVGMIHLRDVLWLVRENPAGDLRELAHELMVVSEEESLEVLLQRFKNSHIHMALVADERGEISGLVTLEDVLEQLVGPIQDEFDEETPRLRRIGPRTYEAAGNVPLTILKEKFNLDLPDADVVTLSGHLTRELGRFPRQGDTLSLGDWKITVLRAGPYTVDSCRIEKANPEEKTG